MMHLSFFSPPQRDDAEAERQALAERLDFATLADPVLDAVAAEAAALFGVAVGAVTLLVGDTQYVLAGHGVPRGPMPRTISMCGHAILSPGPVFTVPDLAADARFAGNPLVTGPMHARFYAGAPVRQESGAPIGAVCAMNNRVMQSEHPERAEALVSLARRAAARLAELAAA
jgi:GAF domain-containing protein